MHRIFKVIAPGILLTVLSCAVFAQDVSREQLKGLDEQVQEIKSDVLSIAAELNQLEEKLLYPSHTQIALFMSLAASEKLRLDSVEIQLDGKPVAHHLYSFKELEALRSGGVQRIYTGNIMTGEHDLLVNYRGVTSGGNPLERSKSFKVKKDVGPSIVEITLVDQGITLNDR